MYIAHRPRGLAICGCILPWCSLLPAPRPLIRLILLAAYFDDLYSFDPAAMKWTRLSTNNDTQRPSGRYRHGFTGAGGRLYVHGGQSKTVGESEVMDRGSRTVRDGGRRWRRHRALVYEAQVVSEDLRRDDSLRVADRTGQGALISKLDNEQSLKRRNSLPYPRTTLLPHGKGMAHSIAMILD